MKFNNITMKQDNGISCKIEVHEYIDVPSLNIVQKSGKALGHIKLGIVNRRSMNVK